MKDKKWLLGSSVLLYDMAHDVQSINMLCLGGEVTKRNDILKLPK